MLNVTPKTSPSPWSTAGWRLSTLRSSYLYKRPGSNQRGQAHQTSVLHQLKMKEMKEVKTRHHLNFGYIFLFLISQLRWKMILANVLAGTVLQHCRLRYFKGCYCVPTRSLNSNCNFTFTLILYFYLYWLEMKPSLFTSISNTISCIE